MLQLKEQGSLSLDCFGSKTKPGSITSKEVLGWTHMTPTVRLEGLWLVASKEMEKCDREAICSFINLVTGLQLNKQSMLKTQNDRDKLSGMMNDKVWWNQSWKEMNHCLHFNIVMSSPVVTNCIEGSHIRKHHLALGTYKQQEEKRSLWRSSHVVSRWDHVESVGSHALSEAEHCSAKQIQVARHALCATGVLPSRSIHLQEPRSPPRPNLVLEHWKRHQQSMGMLLK